MSYLKKIKSSYFLALSLFFIPSMGFTEIPSESTELPSSLSVPSPRSPRSSQSPQSPPSPSASTAPSNYFTPLTPYDKKNIQYIISTLANTSAIGLLMKKKSLEEVGARTDQIHPLTFLEYVFTDPVLKKDVKKIHGIAWKNFVHDFAESLSKSSQRGNLKEEYLNDFLKKVGVTPEKVSGVIEKKEWGNFINVVRSNVN